MHPFVQTEVLDQVLSRVAFRATSTSNFLQLLSKLIRESTASITQLLPKVCTSIVYLFTTINNCLHCLKMKEALDYLSFLSTDTARLFLNAIHPVILYSDSFRDSLLLVLRKSIFAKYVLFPRPSNAPSRSQLIPLFSREIGSRKIAVIGFLLMLQAITIPVARSDTPVIDDDMRSPALDVDSLVFEILATLKRCLGQQPEIRLTLYEGLYDLIKHSTNVSLLGGVLEILFPPVRVISNKCPCAYAAIMGIHSSHSSPNIALLFKI